MMRSEAARKFGMLAKLVAGPGEITSEQFIRMAADAAGDSPPGMSPGARRTREWRARNSVTVDTLERHINRHSGDGSGDGKPSRGDGQGESVPDGSPTPPPDFSGSVCNSEDSPEGPSLVLASGRSDSKRARRTKRTIEIPAELEVTWEPDAELVTALATKYAVTEERIRAEVPEFRWYWRRGAGASTRKSLRGWSQAFGNRLMQLAKSGALYAGPRPAANGKAPGLLEHERASSEDLEERRRRRNSLLDDAKEGRYGPKAQAWCASGERLAELADQLERQNQKRVTGLLGGIGR